ncbi:hypothetical protein DL770_006155 [Monosporascus sp. CRB-9-2]|nr:hypothetical protein DL770_006155 [Monosporascus sp. CRB-9-2]
MRSYRRRVLRGSAIQGYKGLPERAIGILGPLREAASRATLKTCMEAKFGSFEGAFGFEDETSHSVKDDIKVVAIVNVFYPAEVDRVVARAL